MLIIFAVRPPDWTALRQPRPWVQAAALAVLSITAYSLVLFALTIAPTPYVSAARELSIVIGALLGILFLGEPLRRERIGGAVLVAAGVAMIAVA
ncbi:MAG: EamA family transporter, partial [Chloroflexi bacterium]|nr:EamA family transporter [Chloroflexota bacterium]